jgi:hypothetical protein
MTTDTNGTPHSRIELRIRHAVQPPVQERIREIQDSLQTLVDRSPPAELSVEIWGTHIDLAPSAVTSDHLDTYVTFAEWAATNGYELGPAFRVHRPTSLVSNEDYPVVTVPLVTIAVFDDDELEAVYPHTDDGAVRTVADALCDLETKLGRTSTRTSLAH